MTHAKAVLFRCCFALMFLLGVLYLLDTGLAWLAALLVFALFVSARRRWPGSFDTYGRAAFASSRDVAAMTVPCSGIHLGTRVDPTQPPKPAQAAFAMLTAPLSESVAVCENWQRVVGGQRPGERLWAGDFAHGSMIAASRSGKGAGVLIPTLLTYPGAIFCLDPKGEIYSQVFQARRALGRHAFCIDPWRIVHKNGADTYNPLEWILPDSPFVPDSAKDFASSLVVRTGQEKERFWSDASELLLQAVIAAVLWGSEPHERNLVSVADVLANPSLLSNTLAAMQQSDAYGGVLRTLGFQASQLEGREKASVLTAISAQYLNFLASGPVRDTIQTSSVDPLWLKTHAADLFLVIPPEKLRSAGGFTRFMLTGILRRLAQGPPDESHPVLVILDEASSLGQLQILEDAVTLFAGWGVKLLFVWQSIGQIQESFPGEKAKTFMANMSLQIFGKTNDLETAKIVSERLGDTTVLSTSSSEGGSYSRSYGREARQQTFSRGTNDGVSHNEALRRLMKPEEILTLPAELLVVFTDRTPPILVKQVRYYQPGFWHGLGRGSLVRSALQAVAIVVLLLLVLMAIGDLRHRPQPAQTAPTGAPNIPGRNNGQPAWGVPNRPQ